VAVAYRRDEEAARRTVAGVEALCVKARAYRVSVDSLADCRELAAAVGEGFGRIDVLRFLVSPAASYVTDQRVVVDGGTF
jgi:NAD(P)-dependent dehydrogenase (short-subunit alcohol dehydrogenase family)